MRKFAIGYFFLAYMALAIDAYCFIQVPCGKVSTEAALEAIERDYIDRGRFNAKELEYLDLHLGWIRGNSIAYQHARERLWRAGVYGFGAFGVFCALIGLGVLASQREPDPETARAATPGSGPAP